MSRERASRISKTLDIVGNWDEYFKGGNDSAYAQRYKHQMLPRNMWVLTQEALQLTKAKYPTLLPNVEDAIQSTTSSTSAHKKIRILDYGCGEGRCFVFVEKIAPQLAQQGINVELVAYDPSINGLKGFQEYLTGKQFNVTQNNSFVDTKTSKKKIGKRGYHAATMQKGNVTVKFIHGDAQDSTEHSKRLIGNVDMTMCMFGVLSYIPGKENRQNVMRMFNEITDQNGSVVITLPSRGRFPAEQQKYDGFRNVNHPYDKATEDGDIYYERMGGQVKSFYHLYNTRDFLDDLKAAKLLPKGVEVDYMLDMKMLIDHPWIAKLDEYLSWLTPQSWVDTCASDILGVSKPSGRSK